MCERPEQGREGSMRLGSRAAFVLMTSVVGACAAGAGDTPTAAYLAYRQAFEKATSLKELLPYAKKESRAELEGMSAERLEAGLRLAKRLSDVKDVKVSKETVTGETAVLEVTAVHADGRPATASVTLAREEGQWKIDRENWGKTPAAADKPREKSCADLIAEMKGSSKPDVQFAAAEIMHRDCPEAVPGLVSVLSHEDDWNRMWAAQALALMAPRTKAVLPELEAAAKTEKSSMIKEYLTKAIQKARE
jgi:hypothetical protein